jgi:hypothetical protein
MCLPINGLDFSFIMEITPAPAPLLKDGKVQCNNCKCWRHPDDYIGKKGTIVKRCVKCREKDNRQKNKPEIREKRNNRDKEKKYYVAYREKKRQEDEEAYLSHKANIAKIWRDKNKEQSSG